MPGPAGFMPFSQEEIEDGLTALIAYDGSAYPAVRYLKQQGKRAPSPPTLKQWSQTTHRQRYEELREQFAAQREAQVANDWLDVSSAALQHVQTALEKEAKRLETGKEEDPARAAANMAKIAALGVEKRLTLQGRPTSIKETRTPEQVMAGLVAKYPNLFGLAEPVAEIEASAEDDG